MIKKIIGLTGTVPQETFNALKAINPEMVKSDGSLVVLSIWGIVLISVLPEPVA